MGNTRPRRIQWTRLQIVGVFSHLEWYVLGKMGWTKRLRMFVCCGETIGREVISGDIHKRSQKDGPQLQEIPLRSERKQRQ